ncbi:MAG: cytochrome c3 family protein [Anaerolineae bacterium]|nr:cytochrome c3 family protein [Anaerolineae bacterium]
MRVVTGLFSGRRLVVGMVALASMLLLAAYLLFFTSDTTTARTDQPIAFNHEVHAQNGIPCQYCHNGVTRSPVAGIPSVELCMGCHQHVATEKNEIVKLAGYWERQEPIPWKRVHYQPDYVYFNHQSHITAGVNCGSCHGDVARMKEAEAVVNMNMGFCLDCHAEQKNKDALYDCVVCHR